MSAYDAGQWSEFAVTGAGAGFYWVLAGVVAGIAVSVFNLWILLIEIHR